jgi:hypothetical protein
MLKYHLFIWTGYERTGDDYEKSFANIDEAKKYYQDYLLKFYDCAEIYETTFEGGLQLVCNYRSREREWKEKDHGK